MKQVPLYSAVAAAVLLSSMTTVNAQEDSALDIGRLAIAGYGDVTYINQPNMKDEEVNDIQINYEKGQLLDVDIIAIYTDISKSTPH